MSQPTAQRTFSCTAAELSLLAVFRRFLVGPGEMLCFYGPELKKHRSALARLTDQGLLIKESFRGGYALTPSGFAVMTAHGGRSEAADDGHGPGCRR